MATKVDANQILSTKDGAGGKLIDATTARRKVSNWVANYIGDALMGVDPVMVEGDRPVWRVSIVLAYAREGIVGEVGSLDVDATSAEVLVTESQIKDIKKAATALAERSPALAR